MTWRDFHRLHGWSDPIRQHGWTTCQKPGKHSQRQGGLQTLLREPAGSEGWARVWVVLTASTRLIGRYPLDKKGCYELNDQEHDGDLGLGRRDFQPHIYRIVVREVSW